jgi:hypothetical protein
MLETLTVADPGVDVIMWGAFLRKLLLLVSCCTQVTCCSSRCCCLLLLIQCLSKSCCTIYCREKHHLPQLMMYSITCPTSAVDHAAEQQNRCSNRHSDRQTELQREQQCHRQQCNRRSDRKNVQPPQRVLRSLGELVVRPVVVRRNHLRTSPEVVRNQRRMSPH